jgi:hypothetical protein
LEKSEAIIEDLPARLVVFGEVSDDGTFLVSCATEHTLALAQIAAQRLVELVKLSQATLDVGELSRQQLLDLAAPFTTTAILESEQLADLAQCQSMELRLFDEPDAVQRSHGIQAKAAGRAPSARHEAHSLVIPQGIAAQPALRGQLADPQGRDVVHGYSEYPLWSALQRQRFRFEREALDSGVRSRGDTAA